ncbi:hypothetical protein IAT40_005221 [Kwoniella sp. CBS 6097]
MDDDDDLLRRFAALKAPTANPAAPSSSSLPSAAHDSISYSRHVDERARMAKEEDEELERIADGRFDGLDVYDARDNTEHETEDDLLRRRIARLRGEESNDFGSSPGKSLHEVDDIISMLIASASTKYDPHKTYHDRPGPSSDPSSVISGREQRRASSSELAREAKSLLDEAEPLLPSDEDAVKRFEFEGGSQVDDEESEEQIIARALDEAKLDDFLLGPKDNDSEEDDREVVEKVNVSLASTSKVGTKLVDSIPDDTDPVLTSPEAGLLFPSLPTHIPVDDEPKDEQEADLDDEAQKRLNLLLGLSPSPAKLAGPENANHSKSHNQGLPPPPPSKFSFPGYDDSRDGDTESWCCICNADATIICSGCDEDLYCEACWKDGHGTGDGQERGHRARRFVYGQKPKDQRRLAAA